jgi:hypothetical protein
MRPFNKNEIRIIENLSKLNPNKIQTCTRFLQDTFFTQDSKTALIVKHDTKDLLFFIDAELFSDREEISKKKHDLFEMINLLDYLKNLRYITIVSPSEMFSNFEALHSGFNNLRIENGNKLTLNDSGDYLMTSNPDIVFDPENNEKLKAGKLNEYYDYIYKNMFGLIFPSEELVDFVKHDFKTKEDRKHNQYINYSRTGIIIAVLLGLLGLWNPFQKTETKENNHEALIIKRLDTLITIDSNSLKYIKNREYQFKIDSTNIKYK